MFVAGLAAYGVGLGLVDAAGNMQAVAVEHALRPADPAVVPRRLDGAAGWSRAGAHPGRPRPLGGRRALAWSRSVVALAAPFLPRVGEPDTGDVQVPWRPIVLVGLAMVLFYMVDTAATTWGPTYLDNTFPTPSRLVALATFPYLLATLVMRLAGDGLVARFGPVPVLRTGAVVALASRCS